MADTLEDDMLEFFRRWERPVVSKPEFTIQSEHRSTSTPYSPQDEPAEALEKRPRPKFGGAPPQPPDIFDTDHGVDNVRLHWRPVNNPATGTPAGVTYIIFRSITGPGYTQIASGITGGTDPNDRTYHDQGLPSDTNIYYLMRAVADGVESANSDLEIVRTDPQSPPPPVFPPAAIFDVTGPSQINFAGPVAAGTYNVTMRAEPTYAGPVLFDTSIYSAFIQVRAQGGALIFSGVPQILAFPSNPRNMVAGFCSFQIVVQIPVSVPAGGFVAGSMRFRISNPSNHAEDHLIYASPRNSGEPFYFSTLFGP